MTLTFKTPIKYSVGEVVKVRINDTFYNKYTILRVLSENEIYNHYEIGCQELWEFNK